jgi:chemotaxis protein MotB
MARKKKHEEHENHERWLVSYADFITLLFAFFVVMYAISSLNEGKYRVLSSALVTAFSHPAKTLDPIQYGKPIRSPILQHKSMVDENDNSVSRVGVDHQVMPSRKEMKEMHLLATKVEQALQQLVDKGLVIVRKTNQGVEIQINTTILFASGQARFSSKAEQVLKKIADILAKFPREINVEGYTDNVPISTESFPSNWELSAARAASVVRLFASSDIDPHRLKAIGFGEYDPVASNETKQGRQKNRRVVIVVLNKPTEKRLEILDKMPDAALPREKKEKGKPLSKADEAPKMLNPAGNKLDEKSSPKPAQNPPPVMLNQPVVIQPISPIQIPGPTPLPAGKQGES